MNRLLRLATLVALLVVPVRSEAQYLVELADVQFAKSLGATIQDPNGAPVPKAVVQEFSEDWKTVLRSGATDDRGRFLFAAVSSRKTYFIQVSAPGFDPLRFRLQVDPRRGASLKLKLVVAN